MGRKEGFDGAVRRSECHDNGDLFWIEGVNAALPRPSHLSSEQWTNLPVEWKAALLSLCMDVLDGFSDDAACAYCGEPILRHEPRAAIQGPPIHHECVIRMMAGSVGQQKSEYSCCGQVDDSEAGMTKREAAKAALAYYLAHNHPPGAAVSEKPKEHGPPVH